MNQGSDDGAAEADAEAALHELVEAHAASVFRVARSIVQDSALAEDVVQETFLRAWQKADTFRGEVPVRNWLLRIAHNVAVSTLRTVRDVSVDPARLPVRSEQPGPEVVVEARSDILEALAGLDPLDRSLVVLREVEGLTYDEICDVMDLPMPTVKTRLFRARAKLRRFGKDGA